MAAAARVLGERVVDLAPIAGGDTSRAFRATTAGGRPAFVKAHDPEPAGLLAAEAHGLAWLAAAAAVRVPAVLGLDHDGPRPVLVLEWIEPGAPARDHDEVLGRGLAAQHATGAPAFGLDRDGFIGPLPLDNAPADDWPTFYAERRIRPLLRIATDRGRLDPDTVAAVDHVADHLPDLAGPPEPPARLHGDLWGGNALVDADGRPVLVDPAAHGGHREVDLAMMRLFGGFGPRTFAAYAEAAPLGDGHEDRIALWQLHPLLVHAVLFGGRYARSVAAAAKRYR
ncbi:MAG: fructosamine kinase family protein [Acidimicrobiales bacterium]